MVTHAAVIGIFGYYCLPGSGNVAEVLREVHGVEIRVLSCTAYEEQRAVLMEFECEEGDFDRVEEGLKGLSWKILETE